MRRSSRAEHDCDNVGVILRRSVRRPSTPARSRSSTTTRSNYASAATNALSLSLNTTVDAAAKPYHVVIADGYGEFKAAASRFGGSLCAAGLITNLGKPGDCGIHPTYAGQALLAQALLKAIRL